MYCNSIEICGQSATSLETRCFLQIWIDKLKPTDSLTGITQTHTHLYTSVICDNEKPIHKKTHIHLHAMYIFAYVDNMRSVNENGFEKYLNE